MASKHLTKIAAAANYPVMGDVVRCTRFSQPVGFGYAAEGGTHYISVAIRPEGWSKQLQKELKKELKSAGTLGYDAANSVMTLTVAGFGTEKMHRALEEGAEALVAALEQRGVQFADSCTYCGQSGCDDFAAKGSLCVPAHANCKAEAAQEILSKIEHNEKHGSMLLGIIGAILGGIVGALPTLGTLVFMDGTYYSLMFMLIPVLAYQGYKLFKGVLNGAVPFLVSIVSLLCFFLLILSINFIWLEELVAEMGWGRYMTFGDKIAFLFDPEILPELLADAVEPLIWCIVGIGLTWGLISQGNKQLRKEAEALAASVASSASVPVAASAAPVNASTEAPGFTPAAEDLSATPISDFDGAAGSDSLEDLVER